MDDRQLEVTHFAEPGRKNTDRTLALARRRADELGIRSVVAATTGWTGVRASETFRGLNVVLVTHTTGSKGPNQQELLPEHRHVIEANGGKILTGIYAFGGVGRAVREKTGTIQLEEIIAHILRLFGDGMKVAVEITLMAADAGLLPVGEPAIAVGGTSRGADTAVVLWPANAKRFFELRVMEVLCKPGYYDGPALP